MAIEMMLLQVNVFSHAKGPINKLEDNVQHNSHERLHIEGLQPEKIAEHVPASFKRPRSRKDSRSEKERKVCPILWDLNNVIMYIY